MTHQYSNKPHDKQVALSGKVENDTNKQGNRKPTQKNEGQRTPQSRNDRESQIGTNQSHAPKGGPNQGNGGRR